MPSKLIWLFLSALIFLFACQDGSETSVQTCQQWNGFEINTAAKLWNGQGFAGPNATKHRFKKHLGQSRIVHLASHALIEDRQPLLSKIWFQGEPLHAYEIYTMPIDAELMVLSACNTAIGEWERGEGMMGIERAFQYAGCPALVGSLWSIDDEITSVLIQHFFDFLKAGRSINQ